MDNPEKLGILGIPDEDNPPPPTNPHPPQYNICWKHHTQANTNNVNTTWALLHTTGGKDEPNIKHNK